MMQFHLWVYVVGCFVLIIQSSAMGLAQDRADTKELLTIDWQEMRQQGHLKGNEIAPDEGEYMHPLRIVSPLTAAGNGIPATVPILEIPVPVMTRQNFMLSGWIRYQNVQGTGFLEMWSHFPDCSHYFTRTLSGTGPMGLISGTSDWRRIQLPFQMAPGENAPRPNKIILNAGFQGPGTIWLSELKLIETDQSNFGSQIGPWWNDRTAGWIGGIGGSIVGVLGGLIGLLSNKKSRDNLAIPLQVVMIGFGVVALFGGLIALGFRQPYGVYYPLLLLGLIATICGLSALGYHRRLLAQNELRRMEAMDTEG